MIQTATSRARPASESSISEAEFLAIAGMVRAQAGIVLSPSKRDLVFGRLNRRLRILGLTNFTDYIAFLDSPDGQDECGEMINALTTNLTSFFREPHHFTFLADTVLAQLWKENPKRRIRIWSSACSSGEEPYSIAMVLQKSMPNKRGSDARILATDIDTNMVETARQGLYPASRATGIPAEFARSRVKQAGDMVAMPDELKQLITFNQLNLLEPWPMRGPFDVIFCRNVVIYFDKDTQRVLFDRMADLLTPRGYLFIGHSETLSRVCDRFDSLGRTIYRKLA